MRKTGRRNGEEEKNTGGKKKRGIKEKENIRRK